MFLIGLDTVTVIGLSEVLKTPQILEDMQHQLAGHELGTRFLIVVQLSKKSMPI